MWPSELPHAMGGKGAHVLVLPPSATPVGRGLASRFSIQGDSKALSLRISQAQRLSMLRRRLHTILQDAA